MKFFHLKYSNEMCYRVLIGRRHHLQNLGMDGWVIKILVDVQEIEWEDLD
jgi:hypothetical protein